jgi:hypothetical protein
MASRRKNPTEMNPYELDRFMQAATALHVAARRPLLRTSSPQYLALTDLNQAICKAIITITDRDPPWVHSSTYSPPPRAPLAIERNSASDCAMALQGPLEALLRELTVEGWTETALKEAAQTVIDGWSAGE